jgi:hypothetical protein
VVVVVLVVFSSSILRMSAASFSRAGIDDIKFHPWMKHIKWDELYTTKMDVHFKPLVKEKTDTSLHNGMLR